MNGASRFGCDYDSVEITREVAGRGGEKRYGISFALFKMVSLFAGGGSENDRDEFIIGFTQTIDGLITVFRDSRADQFNLQR